MVLRHYSRLTDSIKSASVHRLPRLCWLCAALAAAAAAQPPPPVPVEPEAPEEGAAEEETAPEPADPNAQLTAADLDLVYDDPRGFMLHKSKVGERWFATQVDPSTSLPQTFELHSHELEQLKAQLQGSPYWRLGSE